MTDQPDSADVPTVEAVANNLGSAYWSVDEGRWQSVHPNLPDELIGLLAPPIVVGAIPIAVSFGAAPVVSGTTSLSTAGETETEGPRGVLTPVPAGSVSEHDSRASDRPGLDFHRRHRRAKL